MEVRLVVLIQLLMATVPVDLDTIMCDGTEVCRLSVPHNISCGCRASSIHCYWTTFADRRNILTNGTTESLLMWHNSTLGYGQFTCISQDASSDLSVEKNVLIIPDVQRTNCDGCINTTICTSTTGQCLLQFSKLFNVSSLCELYFMNGTRYVDTLTEGIDEELLPNSSYYILCPTCPDVHPEIYYEIPNSKIEDCSNSDLCSQSSTTTAAMFTISVSATLQPTYSETLVSITASSLMTPTTSDNSDDDDDGGSNTGAIIGGVIGGIMGVILLVIVVVLVICCIIKKDKGMQRPGRMDKTDDDANTNSTSKGPGGMDTTDDDAATNSTSKGPDGMDKTDDDANTNSKSTSKGPGHGGMDNGFTSEVASKLPTETDIKEVYQKFYKKLVRSLPMKDSTFNAHLIKLFSGDLKERVESKSTNPEAATCFLDNAIGSAIDCDNREPLNLLLSAMEEHDISLRKLAKEIKEEVETVTDHN